MLHGCRRMLAQGTSYMRCRYKVDPDFSFLCGESPHLSRTQLEGSTWTFVPCSPAYLNIRYSFPVRPNGLLEAMVAMDITSEECTKIYTYAGQVGQSNLDRSNGAQPSEGCSAVASQRNSNCCIAMIFERPAPACAAYYQSTA